MELIYNIETYDMERAHEEYTSLDAAFIAFITNPNIKTIRWISRNKNDCLDKFSRLDRFGKPDYLPFRLFRYDKYYHKDTSVLTLRPKNIDTFYFVNEYDEIEEIGLCNNMCIKYMNNKSGVVYNTECLTTKEFREKYKQFIYTNK